MEIKYNYNLAFVFKLVLLMLLFYPCTYLFGNTNASVLKFDSDETLKLLKNSKDANEKQFLNTDFEYSYNVVRNTRKEKIKGNLDFGSSLGTTTEIHRLWLTLFKGSTSVGQTLIAYATGATQGVDSNFDAIYFNDSPVALTSIINSGEYIIQARGLPFLDSDVVALGFKTDLAGNYSISLSNFDGLFVGNQAILLKDNLTGILHNLKITPYSFTTAAGVFNQRFELLYKAETTTYENGIWDYGIPTIGTKAVVKSNFTTLPNSSLSAKSFTVNSGIFTLKSGSTLTVSEEIKNNGNVNQFIIENDAVIIQNSSALNEGLFTVYRNSAPLFREDYTLWSSPVIDQNLRGFSPQTLFNRFYTYNTAASNPINIGNGDYQQEIVTTSDASTKVFQSGKGYLIRMPNNWFVNGENAAAPYQGVFKGNLQNGVVTIPLSLANTKFNLVGNPYPSPISIADFFLANPNINHILYFWRKTNGAEGSGYQAYSQLGSSNGIEMDNIQTGQGFFVQSNTAPALNFNNTMRVGIGATNFYKNTSNTDNEIHRYWLRLSKGSEIVGQTLIGYSAGATEGVDSGVDAAYFNDSPIALTSLIDNNEFIIQGRGLPFLNTDSLPLGFKTHIAGNYNISLANFEGLFAENQDIFLRDKTTNAVSNLNTEAYAFTTPVGVFNERFEVQYTNNTLGSSNSNFELNDILIGVKNQQIEINAGVLIMQKIEIIDLTGRIVLTLKEVNASKATIENLLISNQMLLVRITTKDNRVINHKIMI